MQTSRYLDEIRAQGREEGRATGTILGARAVLLLQGRKKFGKAPNKKQLKVLECFTNLAQLEALAERLLDAGSWGDLLAS